MVYRGHHVPRQNAKYGRGAITHTAAPSPAHHPGGHDHRRRRTSHLAERLPAAAMWATVHLEAQADRGGGVEIVVEVYLSALKALGVLVLMTPRGNTSEGERDEPLPLKSPLPPQTPSDPATPDRGEESLSRRTADEDRPREFPSSCNHP